MKISHIVLDTAHGPLCYADLVGGGRGVTGSEQSMLYLAKAQAEQGHQVLIYMPTDHPGFPVPGVQCLDVKAAWPRLRRADGSDVVISWLSADPLRNFPPSTLRIHSLQINDWLLSTTEFEKYVDVFVLVSEAHRAYLWGCPGAPPADAAAEILPNGVDLGRFGGARLRQPRRCVYLSSPDRGLHWALAMWPEIRFAYPDAELHIYYEVEQWLKSSTILNNDVGIRAKYAQSRIRDLWRHGVVLHGAVSPQELAAELLKSDVMLYPCDTVRFTEGFGVAVLDACAAGVVPIITDCDALGEVYGKSGAVVIPRVEGRRWTDAYLEAALGYMATPHEEDREKVRTFAEEYSWKVVAAQWQTAIARHLANKA